MSDPSNGLVTFVYHNFAGGGLPHYVGEVKHNLVTRDGARRLVERSGYSFGTDQSDPLGKLHHVQIEGDALIEIICGDVKLVPSSAINDLDQSP
jgi:hypothetical protein